MGRKFSKIFKSPKKDEIAIEYYNATNSYKLSEIYLIRSNIKEIENKDK